MADPIETIIQVQQVQTTLAMAEPGPMGPPGIGGQVSPGPDNRLRAETDGLYVPECAVDPLAYYILASN